MVERILELALRKCEICYCDDDNSIYYKTWKNRDNSGTLVQAWINFLKHYIRLQGYLTIILI